MGGQQGRASRGGGCGVFSEELAKEEVALGQYHRQRILSKSRLAIEFNETKSRGIEHLHRRHLEVELENGTLWAWIRDQCEGAL